MKSSHIPLPRAGRSIAGRITLPFVNLLLKANHLYLPDYISVRERFQFLFAGFEGGIEKLARRILSEGDVVADIGAHVGLLARPLAKFVGPSGRVCAFEPDPSLFALLQQNVSRYPQVSAFPIAISDRSGVANFHLHPTSGMSNSLVNAWQDASTISVACKSFDLWAQEQGVEGFRLIKIDVEGAESLVLTGMEVTISRNPRLYLVVEFCPNNLGSEKRQQELLDLFDAYQMSVRVVLPDGSLEAVRALQDIHNHLNTSGYINLLCFRAAALR
jgi:FkbM family methyltransferase